MRRRQRRLAGSQHAQWQDPADHHQWRHPRRQPVPGQRHRALQRNRVGPAGSTCQEIFAVGLRNPFRIAFDPNAAATRFFINDVGQNVWEEIDLGAKGADYGWNIREGHCQQTGIETDCGTPNPVGFTNPYYDYGHSTGCGSITGGAFVPNGVWPAAYTGAYLYGDYVCGAIYALSPSKVRTTLATGLGAAARSRWPSAPTREPSRCTT